MGFELALILGECANIEPMFLIRPPDDPAAPVLKNSKYRYFDVHVIFQLRNIPPNTWLGSMYDRTPQDVEEQIGFFPPCSGSGVIRPTTHDRYSKGLRLIALDALVVALTDDCHERKGRFHGSLHSALHYINAIPSSIRHDFYGMLYGF